MKSAARRRHLYPLIECRDSGRIDVGDGHELYWEESGNPDGVPVVALHGGPGGGSSPEMRRFFDPRKYRIIIFDQRGCGKSAPFSSLEANTTWHLVADMEAIREMLGVERWVVFGGSWGSTLALSYAVTHPERTQSLILRGIFTLRKCEVDWFYQEGASHLFPDAFDRYVSVIPTDERGDLLQAFYKRLTSPDRTERLAAAQAWARWEGETLSVTSAGKAPARFDNDSFVDAFARIEAHYFVNGGFFAHDGWLLDAVRSVLPGRVGGTIVHGRWDVVTPLSNAWALHKAWPQADLRIVGNAGHSSLDAGIVSELVKATDRHAMAAQSV